MSGYRLALSLAVALGLATCATPATYQPATSPQSVGYFDSAIESDRYRVTYRGGDAATARDFALLRAAELTLSQGQEWFRVTNSVTTQEGGSRSSVSIGGGGGSFGGRSGVGGGVGVGIPLGATSVAVHTFEILMGSGPKPDGTDVYDAQSVSESLGTALEDEVS